MLFNPAWNTLLKRQAPKATLIDLKMSTGNSTSYSFTNVVPKGSGFGSFALASEDLAAGTAQGSYHRSSSKSIFVVCVHQIDAATVFGVNSVVWGGVSLVEVVDIGPAANLSNSAIYWTTGAALEARTTDTIVVTPSESITGCAIAVIELTNFGCASVARSGSSTGTGGMPIAISSTEMAGSNYCAITCMTCAVAPAETVVWDFLGDAGPMTGYELLYEANTTEFSLAGAFMYSRQYVGISPTTPGYINMEWSGTGAGSHALALFQA